MRSSILLKRNILLILFALLWLSVVGLLWVNRQGIYEALFRITGDKIVCAELHSHKEVAQTLADYEEVNEALHQATQGHAYVGIDDRHNCGKDKAGLLLHYDGKLDEKKMRQIIQDSPLDKYSLRFVPS